ncbi:MAG: phosphotransferase [Chloroflexota bacterium]|nr:phosphotransferase [Chloroflexota bacterium]
MNQTAPLQKIAEGREAEMFAWEGGRVLRLYRGDFFPGAPEQQARLLDIAAKCGIRVPAQYGLVEVDGRPGIVLEKLDGPDLLTEIGAKPWRLFADGAVWGRLHAQINSKQAPQDLETTRSRYNRHIAGSPLVPDEFRAPALARLDSLPDGDRLNHGDLHPGNIMRNNGDFAAIDWSNASRGSAEADYARSYMMTTLGYLPPGSPWLMRTFARFGRRILRDIYSRSYRRILKPDPMAVQAWRLPVFVGRLTEDIEVERPVLLRTIPTLL